MKKIILLNFEIEDDPNEDQMTAIELNGNDMKFNGFSGFAARDIYDLVTKSKGYYCDNVNHLKLLAFGKEDRVISAMADE